jgi:hypothetical protein
MSVKSKVTVPLGSSRIQHLLTNDAQRILDTPGPLVSTMVLTLSAPLYRIVGQEEVRVLLLLINPDLLATLISNARS